MNKQSYRISGMGVRYFFDMLPAGEKNIVGVFPVKEINRMFERGHTASFFIILY